MAVTRPWAARDAVRRLLGHDQTPLRDILADPYLTPPLEAGDDQPLRLHPDDLIGGYGDQARYVLDGPLASIIAGPAEPVIRDTVNARAYVQASLDLTMQGGTTSGVVYPLAACELATRFRFRNVGGASAGAIAAAFTAAAELGRSEAARGRTLVASTAGTGPIPGPVLRQGFPGLADVTAWLTQTGPSDAGKDEFRLAQLFRPAAATRHTFRVLIAFMRGRSWALPFLVLAALGRVLVAVAAVLVVVTFLLNVGVGHALRGVTGEAWWATLGWGVLGVIAYVMTALAAILAVQLALTLARRRRRRREDRQHQNTPLGLLRQSASGTTPTFDGDVVLRAVAIVLLAAASISVAVLSWPQWLAALLVGLAGSLAVLLVYGVGAAVYVGRLRDQAYGLIAGTAPQQPLSWLDRLAKAPKPTVVPSLVPWLSNSLSQLAGLPTGEPLRFGHLWDGADYRPPGLGRSDDDLERWRRQSRIKDARLVNLELMTTDLTRRRPYRFPLDTAEAEREPLFLWLEQLTAASVFPDEVIEALKGTDQDADTVRARVEGEPEPVRLHRLPPAWDLPVIVAVRLSMSLPGLFQPVRFYRLRGGETIRDDFGRPVQLRGDTLTRATVDQPLPPGGGVPDLPTYPPAEELWFSDGGITSNFPVHFFDATLPRWPTVSLNLGEHPPGEPMQDVWLPQDWEPVSIPAEPLNDSALSVAGAILDTAMSWRDSMQSALPSYRNRIAQVRTRSDEGGVNLFMSRDTIASLALRGALAGARLRTRFGDDREWDRFRWLRLRVALSNLERLRADTDRRRPFYSDALGDPEWLVAAERRFLNGHPAPPGLGWYAPLPSFWPEAEEFLRAFATAHPGDEPNALLVNAPAPQPTLRQVPQE